MFNHGGLVIEQVEVQVALTSRELQILQNVAVFHQIESVKHVEAFVARFDEQIVHEILERHGSGDVPETVSRPQGLVRGMLQHGRRKAVERADIGNLVVILDDISEHVALRDGKEPMLHLRLLKHGGHLELFQVVVHELGHLVDILGLHGAETLDVRLIGQFVQLDGTSDGHTRGEGGETNLAKTILTTKLKNVRSQT